MKSNLKQNTAMKYKIILTEKAKFDIEETSEWYEKQKKGLSKKFLFFIKNYIQTINENPFLFAVIFQDIRKIKIKKFPYLIFYYIENNEIIIIIAVIHTSRSDVVWRKRKK